MAATETFGPFDGTPWAQDQWYRFAPVWAASGVIDVPAASPSAGALGLTFSGLTPTVAAGRAWARGAGYELAGGSKTLTAVTANTNASLSRRDRLVLRRDLAAKTVALTELQGTPASSPAAPPLTQSDTAQWDVPLFSFLVPPNSGTTITGIVDERRPVGDTGWIDLTLASGWTKQTGKYRALNGVAFIRVDATRSSWSAGALLATVPAGILPSLGGNGIGAFQGTLNEVTIDPPTGNLALVTSGANGVFLSMQWPIG